MTGAPPQLIGNLAGPGVNAAFVGLDVSVGWFDLSTYTAAGMLGVKRELQPEGWSRVRRVRCRESDVGRVGRPLRLHGRTSSCGGRDSGGGVWESGGTSAHHTRARPQATCPPWPTRCCASRARCSSLRCTATRPLTSWRSRCSRGTRQV
eukprot:628099-Prymnesium_polylepis.1